MIDSKNKHCCDEMDFIISASREEYELIDYSPETRSYGLMLHARSLGFHKPMFYCPWCGTKLPKDLGEEWCVIIKEKFGIDEIFDEAFVEQWKNLPEEFKTEEWWRKRRL